MAESNYTITLTCDCPYRSICSDNGKKCETCANNPKRSYYRPVEPYVPYYPYYPYLQPIPTIWYDTAGSTVTDKSHYQSI